MSESMSAPPPVAFGQLVLGPPGCGKTTYCLALASFLSKIDRPLCLVNLDPANLIEQQTLEQEEDEQEQQEHEQTDTHAATPPSPPPSSLFPTIDLNDLITLADVQAAYRLGPNGGLLYCMEFLEANIDWLFDRMRAYPGHYFLFDFPGQVELFTHHEATKNIIMRLTGQYKEKKERNANEDGNAETGAGQGDDHDSASSSTVAAPSTNAVPAKAAAPLAQCPYTLQLCVVHLVDSHYCVDAHKFLSVLLVSLSVMVQFELPHVNILSKIDLVNAYGELPFPLDYYTGVMDLEYLLGHLKDDDADADSPMGSRYQRLQSAIVGLIEDYSLVSFSTLNINDNRSLFRVLRQVDKANGYYFSAIPEEEDRKFNGGKFMK